MLSMSCTVRTSFIILTKSFKKRAIRQLIRVTKPAGRIVVIYANPWSPFTIPGAIMRWLKRVRRSISSDRSTLTNQESDRIPELYYYVNPLSWWHRFKPQCRVTFLPWEVIGSRPARALLRTDRVATAFYRTAGWMERHSPRLSVRLWQYPIIILDKETIGPPTPNR
jgi:hypothetical protein